MEIRNLKDTNAILETRIIKVEQEKETLKNESKNLANLRTEHSRLKVRIKIALSAPLFAWFFRMTSGACSPPANGTRPRIARCRTSTRL